MEDIIKKIETLITSPGFFYSYLALIRINLFLPEGKILKLDHYNMLCFQELSFIAGLLLKHGIDTTFVPNEEQMKHHLDEIYKYLFELHGAILGETPYSEPIFYGDSGAFDFQYANFAKLIYREDDERLGKNKNISFENVLDFWKRKSDFIYGRVNSKHKISGLVELAKDTLENLLFQTKDIPEEFLPYFINFSCPSTGCNTNYSHPMDFNQLEATPFILINKGYFLPISFLLSRALYTTPFYWLLNDSKYYDSIASNNRGKANENICLSLTQDIVGKNNSYKNVMIKDEKGNDVTEIDTLLIIGNRAIIFQAKSKKLTEIAKKGDMKKLGQDFKAAVQDPYDQGLKCRKAIINNKCSLWVDGKKIDLHESIVDAYIVCVTLDHYPSVIFQSKMFLDHKEGSPRPICISVFDLEIICHYLKNKFELLFYLHQRANYGERIMAESEIAFLGFHLNQKLWFDDKPNLINILNDFGSLIDVHFPVDKGWHNKTAEYEKLYSKRSNPAFTSIVSKLIDTNEAGYTDAILFLYSIGGESIDNLIESINKIKKKTRDDGKPHDFTMIFGNKGITIKVFPNGYSDIAKELLNHTIARKYKSKADLWIGLGFYCDSRYDVDAVCFGNFPREHDDELQEMSDKYLNRIPQVVNEKLERVKIGRNDPCHCGSGKKYKKCCLNL